MFSAGCKCSWGQCLVTNAGWPAVPDVCTYPLQISKYATEQMLTNEPTNKPDGSQYLLMMVTTETVSATVAATIARCIHGVSVTTNRQVKWTD